MIQMIIGEKGKGKTKVLLEKANSEIKNVNGNVVYLDKSKQHMYEVNNKVRLIDVTDYPVKNLDAFVGFLCGIISQDHDLELLFLDSFLKIASVSEEDVPAALDRLEELSKQFNVNFVISISVTGDKLPEERKAQVICEL